MQMNELGPRQSEHPIQRIKNEMDNIFSRVFNDTFLSSNSFWNESTSFTPRCNIKEQNNNYLVEAEIPGVDPKDIDIEVRGNILTIKGERKQEAAEEKDNKMHIIERSYGSF